MRCLDVFMLIVMVALATIVVAEGLFGCLDPYGGVPVSCLFLPDRP